MKRFLALALLCVWPLITCAEESSPAVAINDAPVKVGENRSGFSQLASRSIAGSLYFFGAILVVAGVIKKFSKRCDGDASSEARIVSRKAVGQNASLLVVEIEGRRFLLGSGAPISLLAELTPNAFVPTEREACASEPVKLEIANG